LLSKYKNYLLLHLTVFIYGFTGILGKLISIEAEDLVWYRLLIAVAATTKQLLYYLLTGLVIASHWVFFYLSIKAAPVSIAVVCLSSSTFFTALIEPLFYKRKVIVYEVLLGFVIIFSLYLIFKINYTYKLGMIYGIVSAFLASVFPVLNGMLTKGGNAYTITFYELGGGFLFLTIYFGITGHFNAGFFNIGMADIIWLTLLGIVCTAFTFVISVAIMKEISPYTVVLSINLEPLYTIILAAIMLGESDYLSASFYVGTVFILSTIFINAYLKKRFSGA
jgi:drug/metabolite transporter (DMT)-like permease